MDKRTTAFLNMVSATLKVLEQQPTQWNSSAPARRKVAELKSDYQAAVAAAQSGSAIITGVTDDKEAAADAAIEVAEKLARLTQGYALETKNNELYQQMRVSVGQLDDLAAQELVVKLRELHRLMTTVGQPLEEYEVTPARLQNLDTLITRFDDKKSNTRVATTNRIASNASLPEIMRRIRVAFTVLDSLVKGKENADPIFVQEYLAARNIINSGGRGGNKPNDTK